MKYTMEFNLPDEAEEFKTALNGSKYYSALWNIMHEILRKRVKQGEIK